MFLLLPLNIPLTFISYGETMKLIVKERTLVKPAEKTVGGSVWLSDPDLISRASHVKVVYIYRSNGASNFFNPSLLKEALSKLLVPFYPMAGRFKLDKDGRLEINCNDEGVLFVEAESPNSTLDDLRDFLPSPELDQLIPTVDYSAGISSYPFLVSQITKFICGGVALAVAVEHRLVDGPSSFYLVNSWSEIARGVQLTTQPLHDRTILSARKPPQPVFDHIEYQPTPTMDTCIGESISTRNFRVTKEQLGILKAKAKGGAFESLAAHIWRSVTKARALPNDQETRVYFAVNGRYSRLQPPIPDGYFGNTNFDITSIGLAGDLLSKPLWFTVNLIRTSLVRADNEYLKSNIDYSSLRPNIKRLQPHMRVSPNFGINSWVRLPGYEADFGWGKPFYMGPGGGTISFEGAYILSGGATKDGSSSVIVALQSKPAKVFEKLFWEEFEQVKGARNLSQLQAKI